MRDEICVVTGVPGDECEACHIVPNSRPDVSQVGGIYAFNQTIAHTVTLLSSHQLYDRILGAEQDLNRYQDWAGLLLASSLHKHFDQIVIASSKSHTKTLKSPKTANLVQFDWNRILEDHRRPEQSDAGLCGVCLCPYSCINISDTSWVYL